MLCVPRAVESSFVERLLVVGAPSIAVDDPMGSLVAVVTFLMWGHWCLYLVVNPRKKKFVDLELACGPVSKFYW